VGDCSFCGDFRGICGEFAFFRVFSFDFGRFIIVWRYFWHFFWDFLVFGVGIIRFSVRFCVA